MSGQGLLHIYTGEGKGKTTSSIGLALRSRGRGRSVLFVQFFKQRESQSELSQLEQLGISTIVFEAIKSPFFHPSVDRDYLRTEVSAALQRLDALFVSSPPDLVVLDEFICLVSEQILTESDASAFIRSRPPSMEMVLTGRGATEGIIDLADYVTYMVSIKHPFDRGVLARRGIEI